VKGLWIVVFFVCFTLFGIFSLSASALKIGVFDIQKIIRESKVVEGYRQRMGKEVESKRKVFIERQGSARQIEDKIRKNGRIPPSERKSLEERLATEIKEIRRLREDIDIELKRLDIELTQRALKEIEEVIKEIAKKEDYTIVFEKNAAGIVHFKDAIDITSKIIAIYDKR